MPFFMNAKPLVARRDKAGAAAQAAAWAKRATQYRRATSDFPEGWPSAARSQRRAVCLGLPAKAAPRDTGSAPLTTNASHEKGHHTL
jgi:hypothetical protein